MSDNPADCTLHRVHHPSVGVLHQVQVGDQLHLVCGTGLDNLKACVLYMQGKGPSPAAKIGRGTWDLAQEVLDTNTVLT